MSVVAETATLIHGYTMADLDRLARAVASSPSAASLDFADRHDYAWHAIAERLYDRTLPPPQRVDLLNAGWSAMREEVSADQHHHGKSVTGDPAPRTLAYWNLESRVNRPRTMRSPGSHQDFTDQLVERLALPALLSLLTDAEYEGVSALAVHGSIELAAEALGIKRAALNARIKAARGRLKAAWFAPETPQKGAWHRDDVCRYGHARAEHSHKDGRGNWRCQLCERNRMRRARARMDNAQLDDNRRKQREAKAAKRAPLTAA